MVCFQSAESPALSVESPVADQYPRVRVSMPRPPDTDGDNKNNNNNNTGGDNNNNTGGDSDAPADTVAADAESTEPAKGDSGPSQASGQASTARTEPTSNRQPVISSSSLQPPSSDDIITSNSLRSPPSSDIITSNSLRSPYSRFSNYQLVDSKPQVRRRSV